MFRDNNDIREESYCSIEQWDDQVGGWFDIAATTIEDVSKAEAIVRSCLADSPTTVFSVVVHERRVYK